MLHWGVKKKVKGKIPASMLLRHKEDTVLGTRGVQMTKMMNIDRVNERKALQNDA